MRTFLIALTASTLLASASLLAGCGDDESGAKGATDGGTTADGTGTPSAKGSLPSTIKAPNGWPSAEERRFAPDREPSPFSAQQIAAGCGPESKRIYRFVMSKQEVSYKRWTFRDQTAEGCTFVQADCDKDGVVTDEPKASKTTWKQLQSHAAWPAAQTSASEARLEVPAGAYECMHYEVSRKGPQGIGEDKYWFAWDLPGPPIRMERRVGGELMVTMTLMQVEGVAAK